jgi:UDP-2-acetamido-2-deoxy-ribo-hexuluronate aminotransferase
MEVKYYQINKDFLRINKIFFKKINKLGLNGDFILGDAVIKLENALKKLLKVKYVICVANGTDALEIALLATGVKKNQEIITASNSFVSTANAIVNVGAKPVFCDIDNTFNIDPEKIENLITKKTFGIMPVHLNGLPACMHKINKLGKKHNLVVIEDAAQSILTTYGSKYTGTIGDIGCFSMHPTKNLGLAGDGGFITTNNLIFYNKIKKIRNHGLEKNQDVNYIGRNSRLDNIQAEYAMLRIKYLKQDIKARQKIASIYSTKLKNYVKVPELGCCKKNEHTYHRYVIRSEKRNDLFNFLKNRKIDVKIHYKKNIHEQKAFKKYANNKDLKTTQLLSNQTISLPCNHFMTNIEINYVVKSVQMFFKKN